MYIWHIFEKAKSDSTRYVKMLTASTKLAIRRTGGAPQEHSGFFRPTQRSSNQCIYIYIRGVKQFLAGGYTSKKQLTNKDDEPYWQNY